MKTALLLSLAIGGSLFASMASAHTYPARRSIAVQAEKDAIVLLAVWTTPAGEAGDLFEIGASLSAGSGKAQRALEAQLAAKAIGPLTLTIDGKPLAPDSVRTPLIEEPPRSGRRAIAVLLEAKVPAGAHDVTVTLGSAGDATRMNFVDRSKGAAVATGRIPEGGLVPSGTSFTLHWKDRK